MEPIHKVFNLIILDESGSMYDIQDMIISGFNEIVQTVKGVAAQYPEQKHFITLVSFNSLAVKTILENEDVSRLKEIDRSLYKPSAGTPLYDAMGNSIQHLRQLTDSLTNFNVLVTILTDGEENSSREFSGKAIKKMIEELKQKNWTFTYIGANHDVDKFALSISIINTMKFEANETDMKRMFTEEKNSRSRYSEKIRNKENTADDFYKE
ncbi:MAG: VWA domain-containing protein [Bacteroidales bacterium]|nr:VWA domain-containing protein [Bacteroidales bacterium]